MGDLLTHRFAEEDAPDLRHSAQTTAVIGCEGDADQGAAPALRALHLFIGMPGSGG